MTIEPYVCSDDGRRRALLAQVSPALNAIDYLEIASADEATLAVYFLFDLPGGGGANPVPASPALTPGNIRIEGAGRVFTIASVAAAGNVLTVVAAAPVRGFDYATYRFSIVASPTHPVTPAGFDPKLSAIDFSFKANCPSEFDCKQDLVCPPKVFAEPELDYLAKDFNTFKRLMLDRLSVLMPDWTERHSADLQNTLVDLLAYVADYLSWYQDAVATEAYLGTARKRISLVRHARLLGYEPLDGCNARTFVQFQVSGGPITLAAHTPILTRGGDGNATVVVNDFARALVDRPFVFETLHDGSFTQAHNQIQFYTWQDQQCWLPCGTTSATLADTGLVLAPGDFLLFEEIAGPESGLPADADWQHRQVVRLTSVASGHDPLGGAPVVEIAWDPADALTFALCLSARTSPSEPPFVVSVARGNVVLADHGLTVSGEALDPPAVPDTGPYRPMLPELGVTFAVPFDANAVPAPSASALLAVSPRDALASVEITDAYGAWTVRRDVLSSGRFARDFVVEVEDDGTASLRFGDNVLGAAPQGGTQFALTFRIGSGPQGNLGAGTLARAVTNTLGITSLYNPLPAIGGTDPESLTEIRQYAPQAFRVQERAVTEEDYATMAMRFTGVADAVARIRWTGSWYTAYVYVRRANDQPVDSDLLFVAALKHFLDGCRMAGVDLEIRGPVVAALDLALGVCVKTGYVRANVKRDLLAAFAALFAPGNFTFGTPLYESRLYATAMAVAGVESVTVTRMQRLRMTPAGELAAGVIHAAPLEILHLDNDPSAPENGQIEIDMWGGL